ncbi:MAG: hypothetical protein ABIH66_12275 [bacterium]
MHFYFGPRALIIAAVAVLLGLLIEKFLPGHGIIWSLRHFFSKVLLANSRLKLLWLFVLIVFCSFWVPALFPMFLPEKTIEGLSVEKIHDVGPFDMALLPDGRGLFMVFAHMPERGDRKRGVMKIDFTGKENKKTFIKIREDHACFLTVVPELNVSIVHSNARVGGRKRLLTYFIDLAEMKALKRYERGFRYLIRSTYDPQTQKIYLIDKKRTLVEMPVKDFIEGRMSNKRTFALDDVGGFEQALLHPDKKDRIFCRGEAGNYISELDLATGKTRNVYLPWGHWDIALDPKRKRLYVARMLKNAVSVIDYESMTHVRDLFVGGMPRSVLDLGPLNAFAVGQYCGKKIRIYDAETFRLLFQIKTCTKVRKLLYDEGNRHLYFSDACGLKRIRFPEHWRMNGVGAF